MSERALRFLAPRQLAVLDVDAPTPGPDDALVAPRFVGLCGTDAKLLDGSLAYFAIAASAYPVQPGHEWSGVVVRSGRPDLPPGTPVIGDPIVGCRVCDVCAVGPETHCNERREQGVRGDLPGAASTLIAFPDRNLHRVPDGVPLDHAALAEPTVTVMEGIARLGAAAASGAEVMVIGAGTLGLIAAQLLVDRGCAVSVAVRGRTAGERAERAGARALQLGNGSAYPSAAFDGVVEASGGVDATAIGLEALRPGGTIAVLGVPPGRIPGLDLVTMIVRDLTMTGCLNGPGRYEDALNAIRDGRVQADLIVDAVIPLVDAASAFGIMADRSRLRPKVMLSVTPGESFPVRRATLAREDVHLS